MCCSAAATNRLNACELAVEEAVVRIAAMVPERTRLVGGASRHPACRLTVASVGGFRQDRGSQPSPAYVFESTPRQKRKCFGSTNSSRYTSLAPGCDSSQRRWRRRAPGVRIRERAILCLVVGLVTGAAVGIGRAIALT